MDERSATIALGGENYELILTTGATKAIARRYDGLESLGEKLLKAENFEATLDELIWLLCLLANQSILLHNLQNPCDKRPLLTEEALELLTSPFDLVEYKMALTEALFRGTKRNIQSAEADEPKNAAGA
jgi:hypothetical protein